MRPTPTIRLAALAGLLAGCGSHATEPVLPGVDVAHRGGFAELGDRRVGLITNATGRLRDGTRTIDALLAADVALVRLFTPEHGLFTDADGVVGDAVDPATALPVVSLYGAARRPRPADLADLDLLAFDVQDAGARFYTYLSTLTLALEAAAASGLAFVVYDRPNPVGGVVVEGPGRDPDRESFTAIHDVPVRHGMTLGELARLVVAERDLPVELTVVACTGWRRGQTFERTGLAWRDPSPNLKTIDGTLLYPGLALLEFTNLSVGRGTATPFEHVGAPWLDAERAARELAALELPGVRIETTEMRPGTGPYAGERCPGLRFRVVDRDALRAVPVGLALARTLDRLHPDRWDASALDRLLCCRRLAQDLLTERPLDELLREVRIAAERFVERRRPYLLYPR